MRLKIECQIESESNATPTVKEKQNETQYEPFKLLFTLNKAKAMTLFQGICKFVQGSSKNIKNGNQQKSDVSVYLTLKKFILKLKEQ